MEPEKLRKLLKNTFEPTKKSRFAEEYFNHVEDLKM